SQGHRRTVIEQVERMSRQRSTAAHRAALWPRHAEPALNASEMSETALRTRLLPELAAIGGVDRRGAGLGMPCRGRQPACAGRPDAVLLDDQPGPRRPPSFIR